MAESQPVAAVAEAEAAVGLELASEIARHNLLYRSDDAPEIADADYGARTQASGLLEAA